MRNMGTQVLAMRRARNGRSPTGRVERRFLVPLAAMMLFGSFTPHILHAQAAGNKPGYLVIHSDSRNSAWVQEYTKHVGPMIAARGGRYTFVSQSVELLEGAGHVPRTIAVIEFPSVERAKEFLNSKEYEPYAKLRRANATATIFGVSAR